MNDFQRLAAFHNRGVFEMDLMRQYIFLLIKAALSVQVEGDKSCSNDGP